MPPNYLFGMIFNHGLPHPSAPKVLTSPSESPLVHWSLYYLPIYQTSVFISIPTLCDLKPKLSISSVSFHHCPSTTTPNPKPWSNTEIYPFALPSKRKSCKPVSLASLQIHNPQPLLEFQQLPFILFISPFFILSNDLVKPLLPCSKASHTTLPIPFSISGLSSCFMNTIEDFIYDFLNFLHLQHKTLKITPLLIFSTQEWGLRCPSSSSWPTSSPFTSWILALKSFPIPQIILSI